MGFFNNQQLQLVVGILLSYAAVMLQLVYRPYKAASDNSVAVLLLTTLFLIMFGGLLAFIQRQITASAGLVETAALEAIGYFIGFSVLVAFVSFVYYTLAIERRENRPKRLWIMFRKLLSFGSPDFHGPAGEGCE